MAATLPFVIGVLALPPTLVPSRTASQPHVALGQAEGLSERAIEVTCFPWGPQWSWERKGVDELAGLFTGGRFSRTELVRAFRRHGDEVFPDRLEIRLRSA